MCSVLLETVADQSVHYSLLQPDLVIIVLRLRPRRPLIGKIGLFVVFFFQQLLISRQWREHCRPGPGLWTKARTLGQDRGQTRARPALQARTRTVDQGQDFRPGPGSD